MLIFPVAAPSAISLLFAPVSPFLPHWLLLKVQVEVRGQCQERILHFKEALFTLRTTKSLVFSLWDEIRPTKRVITGSRNTAHEAWTLCWGIFGVLPRSLFTWPIHILALPNPPADLIVSRLEFADKRDYGIPQIWP